VTWNYRVLRHHKDDETWYSLHEVYYRSDGLPRAYTADPVGFVSDGDAGPEGIAKALRLALNDAEKRPVLDADTDFPKTVEEAYAGEPPPILMEDLEAELGREFDS
jgi:hypothetical protein